MNNFKKIALITGASQGIGKAISFRLAENNFSLYLLSRSHSKLLKLKKQIHAKTGNKKIEIIVLNLENRINKKILSYFKKKIGYPNILINNAGGPESGNFFKITQEMWNKTLNRNLMSIVNLSKLLSKNMIKKKWGRIINISSTVAKEPSSIMVQSSTARAGVLAFSKAISYELAKHNVTINSILLGGVETDRLKKLIRKNSKNSNLSFNNYKKKLLSSIPVNRFSSPEEIADIVEFLSSEKSGYITGQNIIVDGGLTKSI